MAGQDIRLTISAKDDASKVIEKVAKGLDKVGDSAEDAGDAIIRQLNEAFDKTEAQIKLTASAADKLAMALGPELAQRADTTALVGEFRALGLTFEQIEAKADQLAATIKRADDVKLSVVRSELGQVDDKMRQVGATTDRSRGVMANFAGNAAQDLPGVSKSMGALNVAVGQFAEYATEGDIKMAQFLKTAAGMAVAAGGAAALAFVLKGIADEKAFEKERVKSWADEVREGKSAIEILNDEMRETERIERGTFGGAQDITRAVARTGLTMETFNALALKGEDAWMAWAEESLRAGASALDVTVIMDGLKDAHKGIADATTASAARAKVFGAEIVDMSSAVERGNHAAEEFAATLAGEVKAAMEANNAQFVAAAQAEQRAARALRDYNSAWDALTGEIDQSDAMIGLIEGFDDLAEAHKATAEAGKKSAAEQKAAFLAEGKAINDQKQKVIDFGKEVLGLPSEHVSTLLALLDEGQFAEVERRLAILGRNRTVNVGITSRGGAGYDGGLSGVRAAGGPVSPGGAYLVGEKGPEVLQMGSTGGYVHPNGSAGGGGITINVNAGLSSPRDTAKAIAEMLTKYGYR